MIPLRENRPLAGVHFRGLAAPMDILLHGAKNWLLSDLIRVDVTELSVTFWGIHRPTGMVIHITRRILPRLMLEHGLCIISIAPPCPPKIHAKDAP